MSAHIRRLSEHSYTLILQRYTVAKSQNLISWTCQNTTIGNFTVLFVATFLALSCWQPIKLYFRISNTDPTISVSPLAIIAIQQTFDCSIIITQDQANQPAGNGWLVLLANPLNISDVRLGLALFSLLFALYLEVYLWSCDPHSGPDVIPSLFFLNFDLRQLLLTYHPFL